MKKILVLLLTCTVLSGCASTYEAKQGGLHGLINGGYTSTKIQDDIYKIAYEGNAATSSDITQNYALLRCAEVALENNYKYFIIVDKQLESKQYINESGTSFVPVATNTIKCFKGKSQDSTTMVYDAQQISENIKKQYNIK